ncbi:hypothetical protein Bca52824_095001 [Brassica carinata]|uniref:Pentatricopeptide repeat-containing protein n=1 Tax=Brassica carinata TaxID=52824 RepID=A0A8X7P2I8_BRACI|nr:hypothetical protein Bca52824_095001 [Brassica carinata]
MKSDGLKLSSTIVQCTHAQKDGLKLSLLALSSLMKAVIRVDKFQNVRIVYEEMIMAGCKPDRKARSLRRSALRYMKQLLRAS